MNELYHHGILGQKWGVRRFQNKDGTRTPAGKKRYSDEEKIDASKFNVKSSKSNELDREIRKQKIINTAWTVGAAAATAYAMYSLVKTNTEGATSSGYRSNYPTFEFNKFTFDKFEFDNFMDGIGSTPVSSIKTKLTEDGMDINELYDLDGIPRNYKVYENKKRDKDYYRNRQANNPD